MPLAHFPGPDGFICNKCKIKYSLKNIELITMGDDGYWICKKCLNIKDRKEKLNKLNEQIRSN